MAFKYNPFTGELDYVMGPGGGTASIAFDTDSGTANPTGAGVITFTGGAGISVSGAGSTVTVELDSVSALDFLADSGTATPAADEINIIGGAGITTSASGNTVTIAADSPTSGFTWNEITGTSSGVLVENGYIANNSSLVTLTLPATAAIGKTMAFLGKGTGLYRIAQNAGQTIHFVASSTTTGAGGSLTAVEQFDGLTLVCTTANTDFTVISSSGNFTVA
jgi:hypothetical protein